MVVRIYVAIEYFYVATELAEARRNYVAIEQLYVATKLAREGRISTTIGDFYVATELATTESSTTHDRAGCAKVGVYDRPWVRTKGKFYRDREFSVATDLDSEKKKKKTPRIWASQLYTPCDQTKGMIGL